MNHGQAAMPAPQAAPNRIGDTISHYEILAKVGEGGMGAVYKARDSRLDRIVALKFLTGARASDADRRARFLREAKSASALNHPNIAVVYDVEEAGDGSFIAMEYVDGEPLDRVIPRGGMRLGDALRIAAQVADALAAAHRAGIVHRDLKPANIIVAKSGGVKIVDFGLAKLAPSTSSDENAPTCTLVEPAESLTSEGQIVGTVAYMSPEQAEGRPVDARSDIFSFGCVLYEMLAGRRAFDASSKMRTVSAILSSEPEPVSRVGRGIPAELERIVNRCLRKQPERRFQTMADLKVALEEVEDESKSGVTAGRERPTRRRIPRWIAAVAAALVVVAAGAAWWFFGARSAGPEPSAPYPLTTYPGAEESASVSPDGDHVAFSGNVEAQDNFDIYVKSIGSESALRITRDPRPDTHPKWSPDGRWIAFAREGRALVISPFGGSERVLADGIRATRGWTADSQFVLASAGDATRRTLSLFAISVANGERRTILSAVAAENAFVSHTGTALGWWKDRTLFVARLGKDLRIAPPKRIEPRNAAAFIGCDWTASERELLCSVRSPAVYSAPALWRIDVRDGSKPRPIPMTEGACDPSVSARGERVVFDKYAYDADIWRAPNADVSRTAKPPERFIYSTAHDTNPQYSPDGRLIAFGSLRSGSPAVWLAEADGTNARIAASMPDIGGARWSPRSDSLVFVADGQAYTVRADGGPPVRIVADPPVKVSRCNYSHNGSSLYCVADDPKGARIIKLPSAGGGWVDVASGQMPVESPDERFLYYARDGSILRKDLGRGTEEKLTETNTIHGGLGRLPELVIAAAGFYYLKFDAPDAPGQIWFYDLATAATRPVLRFPNPQRFTANGFSLSPDGQWFLFTLFNFQDDLFAIDHFR